MKAIFKIFLTIVIPILFITKCNGQIKISSPIEYISKDGSKCLNIKHAIEKHFNKYVDIISTYRKNMTDLCYVIKIVDMDYNKQNLSFSISYIRNRSEISKINIFGYMKISEKIILLETNTIGIRKYLKSKTINKAVIQKINEHLCNNEISNLNNILYEPDYMVIEIKNGNGNYYMSPANAIENKYNILY